MDALKMILIVFWGSMGEAPGHRDKRKVGRRLAARAGKSNWILGSAINLVTPLICAEVQRRGRDTGKIDVRKKDGSMLLP